MENLIALAALAAMEIVLGIDNIVFLTIVTGRLPEEQQPRARRLGLALAMIMRILLLGMISWMLKLTEPLFHLSQWGIPAGWLSEQSDPVSGKDLILLGGGLFLIWKSVHEIHHKVAAGERRPEAPRKVSFGGVLVQVAVLDMVFSLDSVITAVGMARALWVMVAAVILAVAVMMVFAEPISRFVERNPTLKVLALSFLILIGVALVGEAIGTHLDKGYIYFAMAFALCVEMLHLKIGSRRPAAAARR